jgi:hypothetical protein
MTLRRTRSGLQSLHVFHNADIVAFCEGGDMLSVELVSQGFGDDGTLDAYFWSQALDSIRAKGKSLHVKSVGNKPTLSSIANDVSEVGIPNILVCMDSDYDVPLGGSIESPSVLYTYGYSWENDALQLDIGGEIFFDLVGRRPVTERVWSEYLEFANSQAVKMNKFTEIEIELHRRNLDSLFDRDKPQQDLKFHSGFPEIDDAAILQRVRAAGFKKSPKLLLSVWPKETFVLIFGKLYARFVHHSFRTLVKKCSGNDVELSFAAFCRLAIAKFGRRVPTLDGPVERHFRNICARL